MADDQRRGGLGVLRRRHRAVPHQRRHRPRPQALPRRQRRRRLPRRRGGRDARADGPALGGPRVLRRQRRGDVPHPRRHRARTSTRPSSTTTCTRTSWPGSTCATRRVSSSCCGSGTPTPTTASLAGSGCRTTRRSGGHGRRRRCTCPTTRSSASIRRTTASSTSSAWDFDNTPPDKYPLLLHYHPLVIYRHQVLKQADVVLAMVLRSDQFSLEQKRRNFDYYDPITTGDSSLSACVQAMAAAQIGYDELAVSYFREALFVDLADTHGNASDGVHVASTGGVWGTIVFGFAGLFDYGDGAAVHAQPAVRVGARHVPDATTRVAHARRARCRRLHGPRARRPTGPDREQRPVVGRRASSLASRTESPEELHEVHLLPPHAVPGSSGRLRGALRERVGHAAQQRALRSRQGRPVLQVEPRRAGARRPPRVRRHRRQRAPSERLRVHGLTEPDGGGVGPPDAEQLGDPRARQHVGAVHAARCVSPRSSPCSTA